MQTRFELLEEFYEESGEWDDGRVEYIVKDGYRVTCNRAVADVIEVKDGVVVNWYSDDGSQGKVPDGGHWKVLRYQPVVEFIS